MTGLSHFQAEVAKLFFSLPASEGFLLAGGGALLASGLTTRPTDDLDFFGAPGRADVGEARQQLEAAIAERGWTPAAVQAGETFVRLGIVGDEDLLVDIAIDVAASKTPVVSIVGPTFAADELAGRKLIALFDRAAARDFSDVYVLVQRFGRAVLLERAAEVDGGFDHRLLVDMFRSLDRFTDDDIPIADNERESLRAYFRDWAEELA
jgi:predicted nucleotidyltransferase component of viral defense system